MNENLGNDGFLLQNDEVHLWFVDESVHEIAIEHEQFMPQDERLRASKYRFKKDKNTFITGRVILRFLLGKYLNSDPSKIEFTYNDQGKPAFLNPLDLTFNLSNSQSAVFIGISKKHPIGVDIEYNKRPIDIDEIAPKFFAKNEVNQIMNTPESEQLGAFYNCWTRKEAFIKALGGGLSIPLDQFEVSFLDHETPALKTIQWDENDVGNWKMKAIHFGYDFTAAAIVRNKSAFQIKRFKSELFSLEPKSQNNAI